MRTADTKSRDSKPDECGTKLRPCNQAAGGRMVSKGDLRKNDLGKRNGSWGWSDRGLVCTNVH